MRFRTGRQDLVASDGTNGTWNPMSQAMNVAQVPTADFRIWIGGMWSGLQVAPGLQYSHDGETWESPLVVGSFISPKDDGAWGFNYGSSPLANNRRFVRFGIFAKSTTLGMVQAELEVETDPPVQTRSIVTPWAMVYARSDTTPNDFYMTGPLPLSEDVGQARASFQIESAEGEGSDAPKLKPVIYEADKPLVPADWAVATDLRSGYATQTNYGGSFVTVTATKRYIRFGARILASSGANFVAGRVRLYLDWRD